MKKLGKIKINPEKLMKNEELTTIKGGYDGACTCLCWKLDTYVIQGYLLSEDGDCPSACGYLWPGSTGSCQG